MNARARELGLDDTSYANPIGLDDPGNYSSARDLATLARELMRKPRFAAIVNMPQATLRLRRARRGWWTTATTSSRATLGRRRQDRPHRTPPATCWSAPRTRPTARG